MKKLSDYFGNGGSYGPQITELKTNQDINTKAITDNQIGDTTDWQNAIFENGWAQYHPSGTSWIVKYRKLNGVVYIKGLIDGTKATDAVAFTLPVGFRTSAQGTLMFGTVSAGSEVSATKDVIPRVDIHPNGQVHVPNQAQLTNKLWVSVCVSFPAEG